MSKVVADQDDLPTQWYKWVNSAQIFIFGTNSHKVASSNMSRLEAHVDFFRLLMKRMFDVYVLWTFNKKNISELVTRIRNLDSMVLWTTSGPQQFAKFWLWVIFFLFRFIWVFLKKIFIEEYQFWNKFFTIDIFWKL